MYILVNQDNSINCLSDDSLEGLKFGDLRLFELSGSAALEYPNGLDDWAGMFFDEAGKRIVNREAYQTLGKTYEELIASSQAEQIEAIETALENHLNAAANASNYDSIHTAALRAALPNSPFHAEGVAFGEWMDQCNAKCYELLSQFKAGEIEEMTPDEVVSQLPVLVLPS